MVVALNVLHHTNNVREALIQLIRVLRPGGLLGLSDTNLNFILIARRFSKTGHQLLNRQLLQTMLKEQGCEVMTMDGDEHYYLWARKPHPVNAVSDTTTY